MMDQMSSPHPKNGMSRVFQGDKREDFFFTPVFYLLVSSLAFFPCLFQGMAYFDDDLLNDYSITQQFLKSSLLHGHIPLWIPYHFAGQPFFAEINKMTLYPPLYLCLFLPSALSFGLFFFLHTFLAGLGMDTWLRTLGLSRESRWVGSLSFALGGCFWGEIIHPNIFASLAWTPWFFAALERLVRFPGPQTAFIAGLCLSLLGSSFYPATLLGVFYSGLVYFAVRASTQRLNLSLILRLSFYFIWGALPLLFVVFPLLDFMRFSDRLKGPLDYLSFNSGLSLKPSALFQFLFPIPPFQPTGALLPQETLANEGFCGLWIPLGVFLSFRARKNKSYFLLIGLGLFFLLVSFGNFLPLHSLTCRFLPGFSLLRGPFRFVFLYSLMICVISAIGFEELFKKSSSFTKISNEKKMTVGIFIALILLATLLGGFIYQPSILLFLVGGIGLVLWLYGVKWGKWVFFSTFCLSMIFTGWDTASSRLGPSLNLDFTKSGALFSKIKKEIGENRVFMGDHIPYPVYWQNQTLLFDLPSNVSCLFDTRNIGGFNNLSMAQRGDLYTLPFPTFLKLMDIQGFTTGNEKGQVPGLIRYQWGKVRFYKAKEPMRLVYAPKNLIMVPGETQRLNQMRQKDFDPYETAILSETPPEETMTEREPRPSHLDYSVVSRELDEEIFKVTLDKPSWLVFSEPNYPGWKARVDEKQVAITTSNHLFRGLYVPEGSHLVHFYFEPICIRLAFFGILLWIISMGLYGSMRLTRNPAQ